VKLNKIKFFKPNISIGGNLAIVGSSASILKKENGKYIDSFEEVIRLNNAITKNFESHVGNKTTLRIVNNNVFFRTRETGNEFFLQELKPSKLGVIAPFKIKEYDKIKFSKDNHEYYFFNSLNAKLFFFIYFIKYPKIFMKLIELVNSRKQFSVGFITILTCVVHKIKPTLFGFDLNEDMSQRSHYYIKNRPIGGRHDFTKEHEIIKNLLKQNLIFYEI